MTLQQLRCFCETVSQGLNLSRAARILHTTQPAITKMIRSLESELDVQLLVRQGPRVLALTEEGQEVLEFARRVIDDVQNLRVAASDTKNAAQGRINIGTTNLQARYILANIIRDFTQKYPDVDVTIEQGTPAQIADWVSSGRVDLGISTTPDVIPKNILRLEAYRIDRCIIAPNGHPLLKQNKPTLNEVAQYRLVGYDNQLDTGAVVRKTFDAAKLTPRIILKTADADLVKSYVAAGLGIAIIQSMAYNKSLDHQLRIIPANHLFASSKSYITIRKSQYLRRFIYDFICMVAPRWSRSAIDNARLTNVK